METITQTEPDTLLSVFLKLYFMAPAQSKRRALAVLEGKDKEGDPLAEEYRTPKEVAQMLNLSEKTVYAACSNKKLRHIRIDSSVRIPMTAVREWINNNK